MLSNALSNFNSTHQNLVSWAHVSYEAAKHIIIALNVTGFNYILAGAQDLIELVGFIW